MIFLKITVILECRFYFIYIYIHKPRFHKRYVPPIFPSPAIFNKANRERRERRRGEGRSEKMRRRESARDKWLTTLFLVALSRLFPPLQKAGAIIVETLLPAIILRDKGDKLLSTAISPRQFSLIASRML